jgi:hypothetical protein
VGAAGGGQVSEVKQRTKPNRASKAKDRKTPSPGTQFEMKIRADKRLDITTRLLWWLVAMSHSGYTFATQAEMAKQLNTSIRQVQMSLKIILERGYFRRVVPSG